MLKTLEKTKKRIDVEMQLTTITPEIAAAWLEKNTRNRKPQKRFIEQFARDMETNAWRITGDAIRFDTDGTLIDGQKRLMACIEADKPFMTAVVFNLPPETRDVIDTGQPRSGGDLFTMRGIVNANHVGSTLKLLINQARGSTNIGGRGTVTHAELIRAYERHPTLPLYVISSSRFPRGISIPMVSYLAYVGSTLLGRRDKVESMVEVLATGTPAYPGCPMHAFREKIIKNYESAIGGARNREVMIWTAKHVWNLFAADDTVGILRWREKDVAIDGLDLRKL